MAASEEKTGDADKESSERSRDNFGNSSKGSSKPTIHDCSSEVIQHELLVVVAKQLLENEHSRCRILLRDDKMGDLSRMYMLFNPIPQGLEYVADLFKQVLIRKLIKLHDKYMVYVTHCFQNHTLFHKALKEAFDIFCNKAVAGSSSAELLATFCDNILKKGGSEKLSDEAIEERLENVDPFSPSF